MYDQLKRFSVSRRSVLQQLSWATLGLLIACNSSTSKRDRPVRVGAMYLLTGGFATYGEFARDGINLAKDEINQVRKLNIISGK